MRFLIAATVALFGSTSMAAADACDSLIDVTQSALAAPDVTGDRRSQLEAILNAGQAAKAAGDVQACEAAMTSSSDGITPKMSTPPARGHSCEKNLNAV